MPAASAPSTPVYALRPGDCLLYSPSGLFGSIIKLKTWHNISHVEVYDGNGHSWASRDGIGVNLYLNRLHDIARVYRPTQPLDMDKARMYGMSMIGTPYGWRDLLQFVGITRDWPGIVCSPFATEFYRAGGLDPFDGEPSAQIAPFEFAVTSAFTRVLPTPTPGLL